jgi:hypothetical protein
MVLHVHHLGFSIAHAPPAQPNARPPAHRRAPMVSYTTTYLRDEINRHRSGEDSRTAIECHRERHWNIEGRNLEKDFDSHAPVRGGLIAHAPRAPSSLKVLRGGGVHCACLTPAYGGLAMQVPAPPTIEVRWDG